MRIGVCPGSFDPVTCGHLDIFERASKMFDVLIVAVFHNPNKKPLFSMEERVELLRDATTHIPNIRVDGFSGLLNEYVHSQNSNVIVRGLRALSDFEYEFQRALLIKNVDPSMETVFMMTSSDYSFVSSSGIKELAKFGGAITGLVPRCIEQKVVERLRER
ncbi:phosphopantetheine adenylyltransferase [Anaerosporomusa subterranea]|uniref:Phosphopantetheine adenylyltransferase n=1 Tax=Anaerosporomusa subterranea TaxID=1794912 RepID=A0A154BV19_ANASB|nr:pantetheine-phosphate adenylyltransferase [Anaerosporomusa subterranea]KYZ77348.1 phosphopantetheine adenylyltransferase [Anaerosporomusa subterranea]MDF2501358.1 coaD [Anaerosporomusa subterranea]